jgi:integrase
MLCRLALGTGFRAKELRRLTVEDFDFNAAQPTITVRACYSKRRRKDIQPIKRSLAELLKDYLADKPADAPGLAMPEGTNVARMLKADLRVAGIDSTDSDGRTNLDVHALRHSYISLLALAGVAPKALMDLARHSDISLTMRYYSHTAVADRARSLEALPDLEPDGRGRQGLAATGTCDAAPNTGGIRLLNNKQGDKRNSVRPQVIGARAAGSETISTGSGAWRTLGLNRS